jgi:hypothetical protein
MVSRPDFDAENFCTKDHANIYGTLSKHGCNIITADEALKELSAYNIDEIKLAEDVAAHVARIKSEATVKADAPAIAETKTPAVQQYNKNKKKKW